MAACPVFGRVFLTVRLLGCSIPTRVLKAKIVEFVGKGDFGLASGSKIGWYLRPRLVRGTDVTGRSELRRECVSHNKGESESTQVTSYRIEPITEDVPKPDEKAATRTGAGSLNRNLDRHHKL